MLTMDRAGAGLAVVTSRQREDDDPDAPPPTSQVVPAPGGELAAPAPGQHRQPAAPDRPQHDGDG